MTLEQLTADHVRRILAVTDALGIHREAVSIPLRPRGEGSVRVTPARRIEIVVPADGEFAAWLTALSARVAALDLAGVQRAS
jgi:hypothetical protein